jgi:cbb3-type cytochrome c oxidase subunit III
VALAIFPALALMAFSPAAVAQSKGAAVSRARALEIYNSTCASCHGQDGKGAPAAKDLAFVNRTWKHGSRPQDVINTITNGVPGTAMLPFKGRLSDEEIKALAALVRAFAQPHPRSK